MNYHINKQHRKYINQSNSNYPYNNNTNNQKSQHQIIQNKSSSLFNNITKIGAKNKYKSNSQQKEKEKSQTSNPPTPTIYNQYYNHNNNTTTNNNNFNNNNNRNKFTIENHSHLQNHPSSSLSSQLNKNHSSSSSFNKKSQSINKGIKVLSRNSSIQKNSQQSVQLGGQRNNNIKTYNIKDQNNYRLKTNNTINLCGFNFSKPNNAYIQNQSDHQRTIIPNLASIQTLKSQLTYNQLFSHRKHKKNKNQQQYQQQYQQYYEQPYEYEQNERTPRAQQIRLSKAPQPSLYMKQNFQPNYDIQKLYIQIRQSMQNQLINTKRTYQKKYQNQIQKIKINNNNKIETLKKVLSQNHILIQEQKQKYNKLQQKYIQSQQRLFKYNQKMLSIKSFIQSGMRYTQQRVSQLQQKFNILKQQYQQLKNMQINSSIQTKFNHLQAVFTDMMAQTIIRYKNIELEIKSQIKQIDHKYNHIQQKVYQIDLIKNIGKQNQIQNYTIIQKISNINHQVVLIRKKYQNNQNNNIQNIHNSNLTQQKNNLIYSIQQQHLLKLKGTIQSLKQKINEYQKDKLSYQQEFICIFDQYKARQARNQQNCSQQVIKQNKRLENDIIIYKKQTNRLNQILDHYDKSIQQYNNRIQFLQNNNKVLQSERLQFGRKIEQLSLQNIEDKTENKKRQQKQKQNLRQLRIILDQKDSIIRNSNQLVVQQQNLLQNNKQSINRLQQQICQLQQALQMTEQIFDTQISKFKQTIQHLQQSNQILINQIQQYKQHNYQPNILTSSHNKSRIQLSKSPKQQKFKNVKMDWFRKNTQQNQKQSKFTTLQISPDSTRKSTLQQNNRKYHSPALNDQFYYPQQNNYQSSYSPMQKITKSQQLNITQFRSDSYNNPNINNYQQNNQQYNKNDIYQKSSSSSSNNFRSNQTKQINKMNEINRINKINKIYKILQENGYEFPVQCCLDQQSQLQLYQNKMYIVDQKYKTIHMNLQQIQLAQKQKIIRNILNHQQDTYIF